MSSFLQFHKKRAPINTYSAHNDAGGVFAHHGLPFDQILSVICSQGEIWYTPLIDDWGDSALFLEVQCSFSTDSSFICQNLFSKKKCSYLLLYDVQKKS